MVWGGGASDTMCTLNAANLPEALSHPSPDLSEFTAMFWSWYAPCSDHSSHRCWMSSLWCSWCSWWSGSVLNTQIGYVKIKICKLIPSTCVLKDESTEKWKISHQSTPCWLKVRWHFSGASQQYSVATELNGDSFYNVKKKNVQPRKKKDNINRLLLKSSL